MDRVLVNSGVISEEQVEDARAKSIGSRRPFQDVLVEMGYCTDLDVCNALSQILGKEPIAIDADSLDPNLKEVVPDRVSQQWGLIPISVEDEVLTVAMSNPMDVKAIDELTAETGLSSCCGRQDRLQKREFLLPAWCTRLEGHQLFDTSQREDCDRWSDGFWKVNADQSTLSILRG